MLQDAGGGVYKKLVLKDDKLRRRGAVRRHGRRRLVLPAAARRHATSRDFARPPDVRPGAPRRLRPRRRQTRVAAMTDDAEVCGCNGVCKGDIVKAITRQEAVHARRGARAHQGLVLLRLVHRPGRAAARDHRWAATTRPTPKKKPMCALHRAHARGGARGDPARQLLDHPGRDAGFLEWKTPDGCASCRPALNYYLISAWPGEVRGRHAVALHQRARARQHPEGRHLFGGARACGAARPRRRSCARIADVAEKYEVPDGQGHRRPAHRPAGREEGGPAGDLGRLSRQASSRATPTARRCAR